MVKPGDQDDADLLYLGYSQAQSESMLPGAIYTMTLGEIDGGYNQVDVS